MGSAQSCRLEVRSKNARKTCLPEDYYDLLISVASICFVKVTPFTDVCICINGVENNVFSRCSWIEEK